MLSECGLLAVQSKELYSPQLESTTNSVDEIPMPIAETLVEHATIMLLVFIALFTLAAWL